MSRSSLESSTRVWTARWKRSAAMLAAATTVVATAGVIAPLAAHAADITVSVPGQTRAVPIVSFSGAQVVVTLGGLSNATSADTATFTQSATEQATGYTNYNPLWTYTASTDSAATLAPASSQPFDLLPTALPPGYYDIEVDNGISGTSEGTCTACIFITGGTPTITKISQNAVAAGATIGKTAPTASTSQFAITGTNFNHDATVTSDSKGITFTPEGAIGSTTYDDEDASGLTVRYGLLAVASSVAPGTYHLTVTDGDGGTATIPITIDAPLVITSIYPATVGEGDSGRLIQVIGSGFSASTAFTPAVSGTTNAVTNPASGIVYTVKAVNAAGTRAVLAATVPTTEIPRTSTGGTRSETLNAANTDSGSASTAMLVTGASPTVTTVVTGSNVSQVTPGQQKQTLTITGANYVSGATVAFLDATGKAVPGITVGTVTFVSATSITAVVSFASTAVTQIDAPTVTNPDGGIGTCSTSFSGATVVPAACFQVASFVISGKEAPIDNSSTANKAILFQGTGFDATSTFTAVLIADPFVAGQSGIPSGTCTTDPTSTTTAGKVSCTFPTTVLAAPVTYDVIFSRTTGSVVDSDTDPGVITITNPGTPTITAISPTTITGADLARTLTLTGTNFANGAVVKGTNAGFTFGTSTVTSATSLTVPVTLPQGTAASTTGTFTVTNGDSGVSAASKAITIGTEPAVSLQGGQQTSYTIGNTGFSVPVVLDNSATGAAVLPNEQIRLALTGLTGLTASQVTASFNNVAVTPIMVGSTVVVPSTVLTSVAIGKASTNSFLISLVGGAPSGSLNVTPSVGDALGTAAYPSTTTPDIQASGSSYAVAVAGPPPTLTIGTALTQLVVGDPAASETVTLVNNSGTRINEGQLDIAVSGPAGLAPGELTVTSSTAAASPVALTLSNGSYTGVLTPAQIIPSGTTLTSVLTFALSSGAPLGSYSITTTLDETDQFGTLDGTTLATLTQPEQGVSVPSVPTALVVTPGNGALMVAFGAPAVSGGDGALTYRVTASASGEPTVVVTATTSPVVVTGLVNGVAYSVFVQAENLLNRFGGVVSALATPVAGATLTGTRAVSASLSKAFAPLGTRVTLTGKLTIGGLGIPGAPVTIQTTYSDGKVVDLGTVITKADGTYSYTFEPLYNGYLEAHSGTAMSKPVGSRVIVIFSRLSVTHSGSTIKVLASTAPGFVTSSKRLERAQILLVSSSGKILKVLAVVNAANRHSLAGQLHGVNDVTYTGKLPAGSYRIAVKIIGTPVNTGAQSGSKSVSIA